jgi:glycosyltransferase involved in cell wall biosynthesis
LTIPVVCIIPVRNGADTLERAIDSAYDAGCDRVIVCDDASTDGTREIIKRAYEKAYANRSYSTYAFTPLHNETRCGAAITRNNMIQCSVTSGHLIIPLDADDELYNIKPFVEAWQPGTWVYGDHHETMGDSIPEIRFGAPAGSLTRKNITGITFLFHKDDWKAVGGYDPDFAYLEDYAFQCALTNAGVKPVHVSEVLYNRHLSERGNPRTANAQAYWFFYRDMARQKYPALFAGVG